MGQFSVRKATLSGAISIPPSKSQTLRAILFGSLGSGQTIIRNILHSPDTRAMIHACTLLGAELAVSPDRIEIKGMSGRIQCAQDVINAGNSGIVLRFCSALGALSPLPIVITGDHSIRYQRPMTALLDGLSQLGVHAVSTKRDGFAPVIIQGPIKSGKTVIQGHDSQPVSSLLIASMFAPGPVEIQVLNPGEKPWVGMTLAWFDRLGISYENHDFKKYIINGNGAYAGFEYVVPGDLSTAAFPIAAALVTQSELLLENVDLSDSQGDKELIKIFQCMGADISSDERNRTLHIRKSGRLSGLQVDINDFIDGLTILAVVACFAEGETHIRNGAVARDKECNRISCIVRELKKMGADITECSDGLIVRESVLRGTQLYSHGDHRMAMSLAVAAMGSEGESVITSVDCISKTFPSFVRDFNALGANIEQQT